MPAQQGKGPRPIAGLHQVDYPGMTGQKIRELREEFPRWDIWFVAAYLSPGNWCARPKGTPVATVNEDNPDDFRAALRAAEDPGSAEARRSVVTYLDVSKRARKAGS